MDEQEEDRSQAFQQKGKKQEMGSRYTRPASRIISPQPFAYIAVLKLTTHPPLTLPSDTPVANTA
jgi:hypothetical protein